VTRERDHDVDQLVFAVDINVASNAVWDRMFREVAAGDLRFRQRTQVRRWGRDPEIRVPGLEAGDLEAWTHWVDVTIAATNKTYERRIVPHLDRERLAEVAKEEHMRESLAEAQRVAQTLKPPIPIGASAIEAAMAAFDAGLVDTVEISVA
jgi:hypothetical protein